MRRSELKRTEFKRKEPKPQSRPKRRKCAVKTCRREFVPAKPFITFCCEDCGTALALAKLDKAKAQQASAARKEHRAAKERLKTRSDYLKEAQVAFNAFIRERDKDLPCICCGRFPKADHVTGGMWDAGHYRSVGSAPHLRFHEDNVHRQLKQCNQWGAGRAVDYRLGLIARIGLARVEALEADQESRKWSVDELKAIRNTYRARLKELKKAQT